MRAIYPIISIILLTISSFGGYAKTVRVNERMPLKEQFRETDAVYLIKSAIDMKGEDIKMPLRSTIKFTRRGSLSNGTLQGDSTSIAGHPTFNGVRLRGKYTDSIFFASWCSPQTMSDYVEDVMNLSDSTVLIIDKDIALTDSRRFVNHLYLRGQGKTIMNADRYYITYGGCEISDLKFKWDKGPVQEPKDNYCAVVIYHDLLQKDTTITTSIRNVEADGGRYCSHFMKQYKSSIAPQLRTINNVYNSVFVNFTQGVIWTCGGTGEVVDCRFQDIGYETTSALISVYPLRLGYSNKVGDKAKAIGYEVKGCEFSNIVASYNAVNDGRELHGLLAYGDSIHVVNNQFRNLSTSFSKCTDTGMDSEMLYIKGSFNLIENNTFKDGAGTLSDGIVTLKIGESENNIVRNNIFLEYCCYCTFIRMGGINHIVAGNEINNYYLDDSDKLRYAIYIAYQPKIENLGVIEISNNNFYFSPGTNYMVVYANGIGAVELRGNNVTNPRKLIKNNKRLDYCQIINNVISIDNNESDLNDSFIELSGGEKYKALINSNEISINRSKMGRLVTGTNYCFENNTVNISNSSFDSMLRGKNTSISVRANKFSIDNQTTITRAAIVGENNNSHFSISGNIFTDIQISNTISQ